MSSSLPTASAPVVPNSNHRETTIEFARWALAQLELDVEVTGGVERLQLPEADQASFEGRSELKLPLQETAAGDFSRPSDREASDIEASHREASDIETLDLESRFGRWLVERLNALGPAVPVRPAEQPTAVNDIAQRLFAAYQVDGGQVHLGGCQLTDYPFLRLSFAAQENGREEIRHVFVAHDGSSVSDQLVHELGLLEVEPIVKLPPRIDDSALQALITAGRRVAAQTTTSRDPTATAAEPMVIVLVWVKHASGKLQFTIGETTVTLPFSGWARLLKAQPYTSVRSGASSFHLAATDDGQIDTFDQIAVCQQSGKRVLQQELVACSVTGKHVLEEFTEMCPVSGKPCLVEEFANCPTCQQRVSRRVIENGACTACRQLAKIKKDDPRLVWILGEHAGLDRWNHWQLSETKDVYIALASRWTRRLLVVVDKETLAVHYLATGSKLGNSWSLVGESSFAEILQ